MAKTYPVGLVGEQHYRQNVERCRAGQTVLLYREPGNQFDSKAIVVQTEAGLTIGYVPKSSFLYDHINDAGGGADAVIRSVDAGNGGFRQVVIDAALNDDVLDTLTPARPYASEDDDDDERQKPADVAPWKVAVVVLILLIILVRCSAS
jgi:hypothetical protein